MSSEPLSIVIHPPSSSHPSLADTPSGFDRKRFMGKWGVAWSTLPMWKDKKDVTITYTPVAAETKIDTTFDDLVEYRKLNAASDSTPSTVKGVDTLSVGANGATFDWKGKGWLFFVSSHWEVLGYGEDPECGQEWAVTFFSKTLFTPAGIDIYLRTSPTKPPPPGDVTTLRSALLAKIVAAVKQVQEGNVGKLAAGGFEVPGVV